VKARICAGSNDLLGLPAFLSCPSELEQDLTGHGKLTQLCVSFTPQHMMLAPMCEVSTAQIPKEILMKTKHFALEQDTLILKTQQTLINLLNNNKCMPCLQKPLNTSNTMLSMKVSVGNLCLTTQHNHHQYKLADMPAN
jgi:hypothetical protein